MMHLYQRASSKLRRLLIRAFKNRMALEGMRSHEDERLHSIAAAVERTLSGQLGPGELGRIEQIEAFRQRVYSSREKITVGGPCGANGSNGSNGATRKVRLGRAGRARSQGVPWCRLLYNLVRQLRPPSCLELGTCVGLSTSYQAAALERNGEGRLCTLESNESLAAVARAHLQGCGLLHRVKIVVGKSEDRLEAVLQDLGPFGMVFAEAIDREDHAWEHYRQLLPSLEAPAVLVLDAIDHNPGMQRVWRRIRTDPNLLASVDLTRIGIAVTGKRRGPGDHFVVAI